MKLSGSLQLASVKSFAASPPLYVVRHQRPTPYNNKSQFERRLYANTQGRGRMER